MDLHIIVTCMRDQRMEINESVYLNCPIKAQINAITVGTSLIMIIINCFEHAHTVSDVALAVEPKQQTLTVLECLST